MKKNVLFLVLSIVLSVVSTILILVFDATETELGTEIAAVFLILGVAGISIFSKKIRKDKLTNKNYTSVVLPSQQKQLEEIANNQPKACEYCGAKNDNNAKKCSSCGARLD